MKSTNQIQNLATGVLLIEVHIVRSGHKDITKVKIRVYVGIVWAMLRNAEKTRAQKQFVC